MSAEVIQQSTARRKRAGAWSWTARHIVLLVVAIAAIIAASWLAPDLAAPPPAPAPVQQHVAAPEPVAAELPVADVFLDLAGPPAPQRVGAVARNTGVPLDAVVEPRDDYEILSAAELAGISQARD